ncbi:MAG: DsbA family protein [Chloroflexi bacterium]|nr:DsbA family protein [Chloroflexota bacterium]
MSETHGNLEELRETLRQELCRGFSSPVYAFLVVLAFALGLGAGYWFSNRSPVPAQPAAPAATQAAPRRAAPTRAAATAAPREPKRYNVSPDDDPALGPEDAPVTIIEFSDYQCPYCRRFREQTLDKILETYGDKVRFVYRDFPLESIHPYAVSAAIAAECADEQGKFWPFHDKLFEGGKFGDDVYLQYAEELGLDVDEFARCIKEQRYLDEVMKDLQDGLEVGVRGTPTFFINGIPLVGAVPFSAFQQIIEQELQAQQQK